MDTNATADIAENFCGNPPIIEKPIGVVAEGIHQRITAEQAKLHAEEKSERDLTAKRIALLTDGTDKDVDACELAIDQSRSAQIRCLERIELLAGQLKEANRTAETRRLDELAAAAERSRRRGVEIITKVYPKLAKQIAQAMAELSEIETSIQAANYDLHGAGRDMIDAANTSRLMVEPLTQAVRLPAETSEQPAHWEPLSPYHEALVSRLRADSALGRGLLIQ